MNSSVLREEVAAFVKLYPHPQTALAPFLQSLLDAEHVIDDDALAVIAETCGVGLTTVKDVIGYYAKFQNNAQSGAVVCMGLTCYINGAAQVYNQAEAAAAQANLNQSVTVSDCLGHCYAAPVIRLEDGFCYRGLRCGQTISASRPAHRSSSLPEMGSTVSRPRQ